MIKHLHVVLLVTGLLGSFALYRTFTSERVQDKPAITNEPTEESTDILPQEEPATPAITHVPEDTVSSINAMTPEEKAELKTLAITSIEDYLENLTTEAAGNQQALQAIAIFKTHFETIKGNQSATRASLFEHLDRLRESSAINFPSYSGLFEYANIFALLLP